MDYRLSQTAEACLAFNPGVSLTKLFNVAPTARLCLGLSGFVFSIGGQVFQMTLVFKPATRRYPNFWV